jgi:hypothetical protein
MLTGWPGASKCLKISFLFITYLACLLKGLRCYKEQIHHIEKGYLEREHHKFTTRSSFLFVSLYSPVFTISEMTGKLVRDYKNSLARGNRRTNFDKLIYLDS